MGSKTSNGGAGRGNGAGGGDSRQRLFRHAREMRDEGDALARATRAATGELAALSREQLERSPYGALGVAFAAGYVLGGGLPARLIAVVAGVGGRAAATMLAREFLESVRDPDAAAGRQQARDDGSTTESESAD